MYVTRNNLSEPHLARSTNACLSLRWIVIVFSYLFNAILSLLRLAPLLTRICLHSYITYIYVHVQCMYSTFMCSCILYVWKYCMQVLKIWNLHVQCTCTCNLFIKSKAETTPLIIIHDYMYLQHGTLYSNIIFTCAVHFS